MVMTIFSKSPDVMWRSRPRLLLFNESCRRGTGRDMGRGSEVDDVDDDAESLSNSRTSTAVQESRLPESSGMSPS